MVDRSGQLKLLDLGLSRFREERPTDQNLTTSGVLMGTSNYISPEQCSDSHDVDIRADLYSLGCTLYELLCGHAPFDTPQYATNVMKVLAHLQAAPRPIGEIRTGLPAALAGIVHRLLAKKTEDRFRTPAEVMAALEPFVEGSDIAGLYREIVRIPRDKHDLTLRAKRGTWPIVLAPRPDDLVLLAVEAPNTTVEGLVLIHAAPPESPRSCVGIYSGSVRLRSSLIYMDDGREALLVRSDAQAHVDDCVILAKLSLEGRTLLRNSLLLGHHGRPNRSTVSTANLYCPCEIRGCTVIGTCELWQSPSLITDSNIDCIVRGTSEDRIEYCNLYPTAFSSSSAKPGKGCLGGSPIPGSDHSGLSIATGQSLPDNCLGWRRYRMPIYPSNRRTLPEGV